MPNIITFELITPNRLVFSEEIYEAILPTPNGEIAVLPNHIPLISLISPGIISLRRKATDNELEHVAVSGGFAQIQGQKIKILADGAERADEIDELKVEEARRRAQELKEKAEDDVSLADATAELERQLIRLKLVDLKKRRHQTG